MNIWLDILSNRNTPHLHYISYCERRKRESSVPPSVGECHEHAHKSMRERGKRNAIRHDSRRFAVFLFPNMDKSWFTLWYNRRQRLSSFPCGKSSRLSPACTCGFTFPKLRRHASDKPPRRASVPHETSGMQKPAAFGRPFHRSETSSQ